MSTASAILIVIGAFAALVVWFAAVFVSFWPELAFKCTDLNWWRRAALTTALVLWYFGAVPLVMTLLEQFLPKNFLFQRNELSVETSLFLSVRVITILLPLFFISTLREITAFRVRGGWIALVFMVPILIEPFIRGGIGARSWSACALTLVYFMIAGFTEELLFRGYAFQLRPESRPKETILVTSAIFALVHCSQYSSSPEFWFVCARAFFLGIGFGIVRLATGTIGLAAVIHGLVNFGSYLNDNPLNRPLGFVFDAFVVTALLFHPSCKRIPKLNAPEFSCAHAS